MTKRGYWISFDLGLKGDYPGLYTWLDNLGAKECGNSFAYFIWESNGNHLDEIKDALITNVKIEDHNRIYLVYIDQDLKLTRGAFLFGSRKRSPWEGYGSQEKGDGIDSSLLL